MKKWGKLGIRTSDNNIPPFNVGRTFVVLISIFVVATAVIFMTTFKSNSEKALELVKEICQLQKPLESSANPIWRYLDSGTSTSGKSLTSTPLSEIKGDVEKLQDEASSAVNAKSLDPLWIGLDSALMDEYEFVSALYEARSNQWPLDNLINVQYPKYQSALAKKDIFCIRAVNILNE
jgi:hypothetical protein